MAEFAPAMPLEQMEAPAQEQNLVAEMLNRDAAIEAVTELYTPTLKERLADRFDNVQGMIRNGGVALLGGLAFMGGGAENATANTTPNNDSASKVTTSHTSFEYSVAGTRVSSLSSAEGHVVANLRTVSVARMNKAKKEGNCHVINGKNHVIYTAGHNENGKVAGRDTRTSTFCTIPVRGTDGQMHMRTYRKECGNQAWVDVTPKLPKVENTIWVNNRSKAHIVVRAKSDVTVKARCNTSHTSASGYGHGEATAQASLSYNTYIKSHGNIKSIKTSTSGAANAKAHTKAVGRAHAVCKEAQTDTSTTTTTTTTSEQCQPTETQYVDQNGNCVDSKNGENGAGAGTPGTTPTGSTVGGEGAGGSPSNTGNYATPCYDSGDTQNGDLNSSTAGEIMYTSSASNVDQFGYCIGQTRSANSTPTA